MNQLKLQPGAPGRLTAVSVNRRHVVDGVAKLSPVKCVAFVPAPLPPRLDVPVFLGQLHRPLLAATAAVARLDGLARTLPNPHLLVHPLGLREAKLSSQIENTFASAERVALVAAGKAPVRDEELEVLNYLRALDHGIASALPVCNRLIREMHKILTAGVRGGDKHPGSFRDVPVFIGGPGGLDSARFVPPPAGEVDRCMVRLEKFINTDLHGLPQLVSIAMAHYQFECIHPFRDGNGRVGRLVAALSLCKGPGALTSRPLVYLSGYIDKHRREYYDGLLRVSTHGDWRSWVEYFLVAVASQAEDTVARIGNVLDLRQEFVALVTEPRSSPVLLKVIDLLFRKPAVTAPLVAKELGVRVQVAQRYIDRLALKGIIQEATGAAYGRVWVARRLLEIIESDEPMLTARPTPRRLRAARARPRA